MYYKSNAIIKHINQKIKITVNIKYKVKLMMIGKCTLTEAFLRALNSQTVTKTASVYLKVLDQGAKQ